jgi:pyruvate dehydrogenase E1 component beta subunit
MGRLKAPYVLRTGDSSRPDGGPHQDTLAVWVAHVPGLKVIVPAMPADAKGLLVSAIRDDNPVICFESLRLYDFEGEVPDGPYSVPIGQADVKAEGNDVTVACVGLAVHAALAARERWQEKGVSVEVLDLRTLRPLDVEGIRTSVRKTGRLVVCHEGWATYGIGAEVVACVADGPELLLRAPARRVGTVETHLPASPLLASGILPTAERLDAAIAEVRG